MFVYAGSSESEMALLIRGRFSFVMNGCGRKSFENEVVLIWIFESKTLISKNEVLVLLFRIFDIHVFLRVFCDFSGLDL